MDIRTGRFLSILVVIAALRPALSAPASARRLHASHHISHRAGPFKYKHVAATGDYTRGLRLSDDTVLSTGWAGGHGARQTFVHDYYRHSRSGRLIHVHGYYRR